MTIFRSILKTCFLWLAIGTGIGFLVAAIIGEHGSGVFFVLGLWIGVIGAITNSTFLVLIALYKKRKSKLSGSVIDKS